MAVVISVVQYRDNSMTKSPRYGFLVLYFPSQNIGTMIEERTTCQYPADPETIDFDAERD